MEKGLENRANEVIKHLSRGNKPEHADTVMELTRKLARYEELLTQEKAKSSEMGMLMDAGRGYEFPPDRRFRNGPEQRPDILHLPQGVRKVSIEL